MPIARVAVVIPCHNDGEFLGEALQSLAEQEPHELVIVDDGSTDPSTISFVERLAAAGYRVVRQQNCGLGLARMAGVQATNARYILPLDADDRLAPGALTVLADALDVEPGAMMAWGDYRMFGAREGFVPEAPRLDPWRITFLNELPGAGGCLLRRDALEAVGGWDSVPYEDWDLWMKFAERGFDGVHVPVVAYGYRIHTSPRLWRSTQRIHEHAFASLRARHGELFAARRRNRPRSPSPRAEKILFPLIARCPAVSPLRRLQLLYVVRRIVEPQLAGDGFPTVRSIWQRVRRKAVTTGAQC